MTPLAVESSATELSDCRRVAGSVAGLDPRRGWRGAASWLTGSGEGGPASCRAAEESRPSVAAVARSVEGCPRSLPAELAALATASAGATASAAILCCERTGCGSVSSERTSSAATWSLRPGWRSAGLENVVVAVVTVGTTSAIKTSPSVATGASDSCWCCPGLLAALLAGWPCLSSAVPVTGLGAGVIGVWWAAGSEVGGSSWTVEATVRSSTASRRSRVRGRRRGVTGDGNWLPGEYFRASTRNQRRTIGRSYHIPDDAGRPDYGIREKSVRRQGRRDLSEPSNMPRRWALACPARRGRFTRESTSWRSYCPREPLPGVMSQFGERTFVGVPALAGWGASPAESGTATQAT